MNQTSSQPHSPFCNGFQERTEREIQVESPSEENIPLSHDEEENGQLNVASPDEDSGKNKQKADACGLKLSKTTPAIIILALCMIAAVIFIIVQQVRIEELRNRCKTTPNPQAASALESCPTNWIENTRQCYYFSRSQLNWTSADRNCSAFGGSLVVTDTRQEKDFIDEHKEPTEYWIGLRREKIGMPWKQPNGSVFHGDRFDIKGAGLCVSLNDDGMSTANCGSLRHWICRKPARAI